jgi:hypothetical protein
MGCKHFVDIEASTWDAFQKDGKKAAKNAHFMSFGFDGTQNNVFGAEHCDIPDG